MITQPIDKTREFLKRMELNANGWNLDIIDTMQSRKDSIYFYVIDRPGPDQWVWMCAIPKEEFVKLVTDRKYSLPVEMSANIIGDLISHAVDGTTLNLEKGARWEGYLAAALSLYAVKTKTYAIANNMKEGGHFIVLNYRKSKGFSNSLRPIFQPPSGGILSSQDLNEVSQVVMQHDRKNNPSYFISTPVSSKRPKP